VFAVLGLVLTCGSVLAQGRLERIRIDENHSQPPDPEPASQSSNASSSAGLSGDTADGVGMLAGLVLGAPFYIPMFLLNDRGDNKAEFPPHPYPGDYPGYLWMGRDPLALSEKAPEPPADLRCWSLRITADDANDFSGLNRSGVRVVLDTTSRLGLTSNWNWFQEVLQHGVDRTLLGDTNLTLRFTQDELIQFYAGFGARCQIDPQKDHWGFNLTYGCDLTAIRPLLVSTQVDAGNLGSAVVVHARGSLGVVWRHYEIMTGYDFLRIGSVNLQGPFLGVRFWF